MPDDLTVSSAVTGLHLVALFTDANAGADERPRGGCSPETGRRHVQPLSQNFLERPTRQGLVFGYGRLLVEDAAPLLARIAACIGSGSRNALSGPAISSLTVRTIKRLSRPLCIAHRQAHIPQCRSITCQIRQTILGAPIAVSAGVTICAEKSVVRCAFSRVEQSSIACSLRGHRCTKACSSWRRRAASLARWSSGLRQLWPYPRPLLCRTLAHGGMTGDA